jgi:hypothetical protein
MFATFKLHVGKTESFWQMVSTYGLDTEGAFSKYFKSSSEVLVLSFSLTRCRILTIGNNNSRNTTVCTFIFRPIRILRAMGSPIKRSSSLIRSLNLIGLLIMEGVGVACDSVWQGRCGMRDKERQVGVLGSNTTVTNYTRFVEWGVGKQNRVEDILWVRLQF